MLLTAAAATLLLPFSVPQTPGGENDKMHAPPPIEIDGLSGVPIDIRTLTASVVFDLDKKTASVVADLSFEMTTEGMAIFDLRQDIMSGSLNGKPLTLAQMATHDLGPGSGNLRILESPLPAGVMHKLHLEYELHKPQSPSAVGIGWGDGRLDWDFFFSDLNHGRYMEMWFPANLIYDHFGFELELQIKGAQEPHEVVTNATLQELGEFHWQLSFPSHFTALSHMLVVVPSEKVERSTSTAIMPGGKKITIDVCRLKNTKVTNDKVHELVARDLIKFTKSMGPWPHGDLCTVFVWSGYRSMEYDGATTTSMGALGHELYHSWYGRGVKPRSQNDGWFDEAWTTFAADGFRGNLKKMREEGRRRVLCSDNPWNRTTSGDSYRPGGAAFHRIALAIGEERLMELMSEFFDKYQLQTASTQEMEAYLFDATQDETVKQVFHRYIYGRKGHWKDAAVKLKD